MLDHGQIVDAICEYAMNHDLVPEGVLQVQLGVVKTGPNGTLEDFEAAADITWLGPDEGGDA